MSEFWKRKLRTHFQTFDFDKDGQLSEEDFADFGRSFAKAYSANAEKTANLVQVYVNIWRKLMKFAGTGKDDRLTVPIFIESVKRQMYDPGLIIEFNKMIRGLHELMDVNEDGYLQPDEHQSMFRSLGVPEGTFDEKSVFRAIDVNGDGKLSIDEFVAAYFDFLFSQDESSPNKFYFGPLAD